MIDELLAKFFNLNVKEDVSSNCIEIKIFLSEVRCVVSDLKLYEIDLLHDGGSNFLVSHIVFSKLPDLFKQELVRKIDEPFPSFEQIEANYVEVIRTLQLRSSVSRKKIETNSVNLNVNSEPPKSKDNSNRNSS